eukprot:2590142-Prymnesium_polylepis.1
MPRRCRMPDSGGSSVPCPAQRREHWAATIRFSAAHSEEDARALVLAAAGRVVSADEVSPRRKELRELAAAVLGGQGGGGGHVGAAGVGRERVGMRFAHPQQRA